MAGQRPDRAHNGVLLYNQINGTIHQLDTPDPTGRPVIVSIHPPWLCVGYLRSDRVDGFDLRTATFESSHLVPVPCRASRGA
jgi:hypothetical protein